MQALRRQFLNRRNAKIKRPLLNEILTDTMRGYTKSYTHERITSKRRKEWDKLLGQPGGNHRPDGWVDCGKTEGKGLGPIAVEKRAIHDSLSPTGKEVGTLGAQLLDDPQDHVDC